MECMMKQLIFPMKEQYEEYIIDESKFSGYADSISFPEHVEEIRNVLRELQKDAVPITIQGGKTGIAGGAVPEGGHILNLSHMNHVQGSRVEEDGTGTITVEPGINLMDLKKEINSRFRKQPMLWPPDPTETSATVGGVAAANAQGICRLMYGPSRQYIRSVRLMDYSGKEEVITKGEKLTLSSGQQMERLDAVLGKEGITGIITQLTLILLPKPESIWGIAFFFNDTDGASQFIDMLKEDMPSGENAAVAAVEYLDRKTIDLIEQRKETMSKIKELPDVVSDMAAMVYTEIHGEEEAIEILAEALMEAAMVCGSDPDEAWAVSGETEIEKMHAFRHGAAETANLYIEEVRREDRRITKLGTDMSVGNLTFAQVLEYVTGCLNAEGLKGCVFGHALENHLHINILPENYGDYEKGIALLRKWAEQVKAQQGKLVGEHGVGKLKKKLLEGYIPDRYINLCRELKSEFDSEDKMNRGNIV